jgi:hypothetical protein
MHSFSLSWELGSTVASMCGPCAGRGLNPVDFSLLVGLFTRASEIKGLSLPDYENLPDTSMFESTITPSCEQSGGLVVSKG